MKLAVIRHCIPDNSRVSRPLSPEGRKQVERLKEAFAPYFAKEKVVTVSSKQARSGQTAELLMGREVEVEYSDLLFSDDTHLPDFDELLAYIKSLFEQGNSMVVMVTHAELSELFPAYVLEHYEFDPCEGWELNYGQAIIIDLLTGKYEFLPKSGA